MNNKYKPKFYARTQPKLAYVKKIEDNPEPEFFVIDDYRNLNAEQNLRVKQRLVTIIEQRLGESASRLLGNDLNIDERIHKGALQLLRNRGESAWK